MIIQLIQDILNLFDTVYKNDSLNLPKIYNKVNRV